MAMSNNPKDTATIAEFIAAGENITISYDKLSFKEKFGDIEFPMFNVLNDYLDELKLGCKTVVFTDKEYLRYCYRPKLLANDIYKNSELDFVILAMNNICNVKEFDNKKVKLLSPGDMDEFMQSVFNVEKESIDIYNSKLTE